MNPVVHKNFPHSKTCDVHTTSSQSLSCSHLHLLRCPHDHLENWDLAKNEISQPKMAETSLIKRKEEEEQEEEIDQGKNESENSDILRVLIGCPLSDQ
jgi:hypothetical protein